MDLQGIRGGRGVPFFFLDFNFWFWNDFFRVDFHVLLVCNGPVGGGGGHSLIWPIRGRAAGQGMFFWPLCPEQCIQFYANLS